MNAAASLLGRLQLSPVGRATAAIFSCVAAMMLCDDRNHVHIVPMQPHTWLSPLDHRCGFVLFLTATWALGEILVLLRESRSRRSLASLAR